MHTFWSVTFHPSHWNDLFNCKYWLLKKGYFFKQISDRLDFFLCSVSVVTTSPGTLSTWSRSTPAPVSTTSTTWTSLGTTPPPSLGGTSCWRPTASTTSTCRNRETRRSSKPLRSLFSHLFCRGEGTGPGPTTRTQTLLLFLSFHVLKQTHTI